MFVIPISVDVPMARWPVANVLILVLTLVGFVMLLGGAAEDTLNAFVLEDFHPLGLVGHLVLHGDIIHLLGNMLFLWVFGNAICAKIGNLAYPLVYLGLGIGAAVVHLLLDGHPAVGASGAINGIVGMFLILYPLNRISCIYWFFFVIGQFDVRAIWLILLWLLFDLWGAAAGGGGVAYWAHIGGFVGGVCLALILLATGTIEPTRTERTLVDVATGRD